MMKMFRRVEANGPNPAKIQGLKTGYLRMTPGLLTISEPINDKHVVGT